MDFFFNHFAAVPFLIKQIQELNHSMAWMSFRIGPLEFVDCCIMTFGEKKALLFVVHVLLSSLIALTLFYVFVYCPQPANILLDENGHVRISDLGLACDFSKKKPHASV